MPSGSRGDERSALENQLIPAAERLQEGAQELLTRYDANDREAFDRLPSARRAALAEEMLRLQENYENEAFPLFSDEIRASYLDRAPMIIHFEPGRSMSVSSRRPYF